MRNVLSAVVFSLPFAAMAWETGTVSDEFVGDSYDIASVHDHRSNTSLYVGCAHEEGESNLFVALDWMDDPAYHMGQFEDVLYHIDGGDIESATWLQLNEYVLFTMEDAGFGVDVEMDALIQNIRQGSEMMFRTDVWNIDHRFNIRGGEEEIDWVLEQCSK